MLVAVANHSLLIAAAIAFLVPFVFIALTSLMTTTQALSSHLWPHPFRWSNFIDVFTKAPLLRWTFNTMIYAALATIGLLVSSIPVAYALARLRWRGRDVAFLIVLVALMLPPQVTVVPLYVMWAKLHPRRHALAADPPELVRRRVLDLPAAPVLPDDPGGVPRRRARRRLRRVPHPRRPSSLRLAKPAIAAVALFSFLYTFNDFFLPLLYVGESPHHWVLSIGLSQFRSLHQVQWNLTMAATLLVMAPVIVLFFLAQRAFVEGVTLTGVKG